ncbi:MAG: molybdopterin molybdotransferase MoeA [Acidimicrobiia bacterium]|nr:molybdopterin molybdotransferase MoeA [Acidimicrobiia bacterium]
MISLEEARIRINRDLIVLPIVDVPIQSARDMVLAETVTATEAIPPFANTAMDGFAVRASDTKGATKDEPVALPVVATIPAGGIAPRALEMGEAMRIMTGAPIPEGADAIVMVELTRPAGFDVLVQAEVPEGNHVRPAGDDISAGTEVFHPGTVLTPGHLGVLASIGRETVKVYRRPRVGVMSTGDELVEGPEPLQPGQIRDSNRLTLLSMVAEAGFHPVDLGLIRDDEAAIRNALKRGVEQTDAVITSGGVSMGDFDLVKAVLTELGDFNWMQVAIKPAKPLAFGVMSNTPVFGLPGNPVSSMVSFELFARPALRRMMGRLDAERPTIKAIADEAIHRHPDGKTHFVRVVVTQQGDGAWHARSAGGQGSHQLRAMASANGLAILADGDGVEAGATINVLYLG